MMEKLLMLLAVFPLLLGSASVAFAQDEVDEELSALRRAAEATQEAVPEEEAAETTFKSRGLGLQALNPEISVTGDLLATFQSGDDAGPDSDFGFRGLGLHFEAYLDPYSRFKAAVPVSPAGAELGEAYFTRYGALGGGNLTLGKFRQQFGVVNRWHKHGLDYVDFPLPLRQVFGPGGLNQTGLSLDWSGSWGSSSQELTLQVTDGENPSMFAENTENKPAALAHYKLYRDVSASTYFEIGFTGLAGWNDTWDVSGSPVEDVRATGVYGLDFTLLWEPTGRMRYRNFEWRTEAYYVDKDVLAPGGWQDTWNPWGAYTSLQAKVSRTVDTGIRFDYFQPDVETYGGGDLLPLVADEEDVHRWLAALYVTWWQSPFVKFRVQYEHENGSGMGDPVDRVMLQCVFAAGPHKHERY